MIRICQNLTDGALNFTRTACFSWLVLSIAFATEAETRDSHAEDAGVPGSSGAPVARVVRLTPDQAEAARQGRLGWSGAENGAPQKEIVPVQWELPPSGSEAKATWIMPTGVTDGTAGSWQTNSAAFAMTMEAHQNSCGQVELTESNRPILLYNYRTIDPGALLNQVAEGNRIYTRARSDYIHPLYGLDGEILTRDWATDHPHHRGIYWAWPEVDFGKERGDLHALQRVFARPTANLRLQSGAVFAQVQAENLWLWDDHEPIVREWTVIRAYPATPQGRVVDLCYQFTGLKEGVSIARRGATAYGGLNIRLATPQSQVIQVHTDPPETPLRRAWSDLSGSFSNRPSSGLTVLQHARNPDYPGEWIQYPELSWVQPTFPATGTRYPLSRERPLVLRFRLWIHPGGSLDLARAAKLWDAFHAPGAAINPPPE